VPSQVGGDVAAQGPFQAELACSLVALPGVVERLAVPADSRQHVAEVHVGAHDSLGVTDLLGDPASLCVQGDRPVGVVVVQAGAENVERTGLLGPGADRTSDRDRLFGAGNGLLLPPDPCEGLGVGGEHAGALGRRRRASQQPLRLLECSQGARLIPGSPAVSAQVGQQHASPHGIGGRIDLVDCVLKESDRVHDCAGDGGHLGRPGEKVDPIKPRRPARVGHQLP
jgi:hypothetical protein